MNAFPMIAACALRQGRGLTPASQRTDGWETCYAWHTRLNEEQAIGRLQREVARKGG